MLAVIICVVFIIVSTPGWHYIGENAVYYIDNNRKPASGHIIIDNEPYYFTRHFSPHEKGWIDEGEERYYCKGNGKLATGWQYIDGKAYFFCNDIDGPQKTGAQAKDYTTSGGIYIPPKGYLEGDEALAIAYSLDVLDRYGWSLESAFKYSSSLRFIRDSEEMYGSRIHKCAVQGFRYGEGNCLAWVGTFCAMAKVMGYDCRLVWGTLPFHGEQVPHGWAEIWEDDGIHVYDPRKHEGKDMSGFDERYGEKGSRKYNEESKQYFDW